MGKLEDEFYDALKESIGFDEINARVPELIELMGTNKNKPYYKERYVNALVAMLKKRFPELNEGKLHKDIGSMASSARLAALEFYMCNGVELEKTLTNDIGANTEMDAAIGNVFFECKCQEIIAGHKRLELSYKEDSGLFNKMLGAENLKMCSPNESNSKLMNFPLIALGIDGPYKDKDYNSLHFDLKQMICHLIAIANNKGKKMPSVLQYIFYVPFGDSEKERTKLKKLYLKLEDEIEAIWDKNNKIGQFCQEYEITLASPAFKNIKYVKDLVLEEILESMN